MKYKKIIEDCNPSQTHEELNDLLLELSKFKINNVLEIGMHLGGSIKVWREVLKPKILIGIDNKLEPSVKRLKGIHALEGVSQTNEMFNQVKDILKGEKLDFIFIDGGHLYNEVKSDFILYKELLRKGGVIALHDVVITGNETAEVYKFWEELKQDYKTKTISYKEQLGEGATGVGVVYL